MRVRSLIALLVIAGGLAYLYFFQWQWVVGLKESIRMTLAGYHYAKTPEDAMDLFAKAIANRDYNAAALYVTDEYAELLRKGNHAAYTIGHDIDVLMELAKERGINTDKAFYVLRCLDPFPGDFSRPSSQELKKVADGAMEGQFVCKYTLPNIRIDDIRGLDAKMFRNALMPPVYHPALGHIPMFKYKVRIVASGDGDDRIWKIDIPKKDVEVTRDEVNHFVTNYKKYHNALSHMCNDARVSGGYDSPGQFESDVIGTLARQNER